MDSVSNQSSPNDLKVVGGSDVSAKTTVSQSWQFPVALASLLLGIAVSLQYRTASQPSTTSSDTRSELRAQLQTIEEERNRLSLELTELRDRVKELQTIRGGNGRAEKKLLEQLEAARLQAGLLGLKGPGVVIRLSDSPRSPGPDPYHFIVHDIDLSTLVNELWASGAEAVEVNGQRIVGRSSIRCVGPTVLVNANRIASPFIVKAIGDVDHLEGGLKMPGGFLSSMDKLTSNGGEVVISRMREVQVPAFQGSLVYTHAKPIEDEPSPDDNLVLEDRR